MIVVDESFRGSLLSQDAVGGNTEISCLHITFSIQDNGFTPWLLHELQAMYKGRFLLQAPTQGGTLNEKKSGSRQPEAVQYERHSAAKHKQAQRPGCEFQRVV